MHRQQKNIWAPWPQATDPIFKNTGQRVETLTQNCFLFALPARMLLVCPAAVPTPHHEAFKYNYRCFLQTRAKMLNPQTQAKSHRCASDSTLSNGRRRCRNCFNGRCCPARSLEQLSRRPVTSVFTSGAWRAQSHKRAFITQWMGYTDV